MKFTKSLEIIGITAATYVVFFHNSTCYYARLNRWIIYQSSPPQYAYVIGSKSDFLIKSATQFRSSVSSVNSIDFWSLEINCFVARVITLCVWYINGGGAAFVYTNVQLIVVCLFVFFTLFYYIFVDFGFCFFTQFLPLNADVFLQSAAGFLFYGKKILRDELTYSCMCIYACVSGVCVLLWGLLCLNFLGTLGVVVGSVGGRRILVRHAHEIDTFHARRKQFLLCLQLWAICFANFASPWKILVLVFVFFLLLQLSGNNFIVNINCFSISSQNKLEKSLLSVCCAFSTLSA